MPDKVRVALIGAGRIGSRHARSLAHEIAEAGLVVVADAVPAAAESVAASVGVGRWTTDTDAIFADPAIDAVVIASSTNTHAPYIVAAAQAGKDIFCEKPIALDLEATDRALDAVEAAGVRLQIGFQRRFDKGYRKAKALIDDGTLGRIEMIRDTMRDPEPAPRAYIETSGGLYRDMVIHNFDCVRWLMGSEADEVYALGTAVVDPMFAELGDIDTSVVTLRFGNGGIASVDNSRRAGFGYDVRTEIFGSKGALFVGYQRETPTLLLTADGICSDHVHWFRERFDQAYVDELRAFIQCLVEGTEPSVTGADARAAMALAYAAEASRRANRPIPLTQFAREQQP